MRLGNEVAADRDQLRDAWLAEDPLPADPLPVVRGWLDEAFAAGLQSNPHAVALATVDPDGRPSARMVLVNAIDAERGAFTMYTNLESRKGRAIAAHPRGAIVFYFGPHDRQVRVEGEIEATPAETADAYFAGRPLDARLGAWASRQSEPVASRAALVAEMERVATRFGVDPNESDGARIPRPPHWGGYTLVAESVELWVSRAGRIHDRARWTRPAVGAAWSAQRLQP